MPRPFDLPEPSLVDQQTGATFASLVALMQRLLAPDGCPWDREQTPESLCRYVMEEACEVIDAIEAGNAEEVREELGDLALQIAFLSELFRARGAFGPDDVMFAICDKLVRRHPHVFADGEARSPEEVEANWDRIKRDEKRTRPLLGGVARNLPALARADRIGRLAATVGFDWDDAEGARQKVMEELTELDQSLSSGDPAWTEEEYGDVLFAMANLGRHLGFEPERALKQALDKFQRRFADVEGAVKAQHGDWPRDDRARATIGVPRDELEAHWEKAKTKEGRRGSPRTGES